MKTCKLCGNDFEPCGAKTSLTNRYCADCARAIKREEYEREKIRDAKPESPFKAAKLPIVKVIGVAPEVQGDERDDLYRAFCGSMFQWMDFSCSTKGGCFNGLLIERGGKRFVVRHNEIEEVTNVTQATDAHGETVYRHSDAGFAKWDGSRWDRDDFDEWYGEAEEGER